MRYKSSWTKQAVEVDSPKPSQWDHRAECPDSTCAQVVISNADIGGNKMFSVAIKECADQKDMLELKVDSSRDLGLILNYRSEVLTNIMGEKHSNPLDISSSKFNEQLNRGLLELHCEDPSTKLRCKGPFQSDAVTGTYDLRIHGGEFEASNRRTKPSDIESKSTNDNEELPSLELSLKRLRGVKDSGITIQDERNVLRRSDLSAFSRYNAASNAKKSPGGCAGSNSPRNNSLEVTKKDSSRDFQSHSSGNPRNQNSNGASNNIDMGSTTNNTFTKSAVMSKTTVASPSKCLYQSSAFQPMKNSFICTSQQVAVRNTEDMTTSTMLEPPRGGTHDCPTQDFHGMYNNHSCIVNNMQHQLPPDHDDASSKKIAATAPLCGSSNVVEMVEGNVGNYSINRSVSGSNNGSNGQNGSCTAVNAGGINIENNNGIAGTSRGGDASGSGSGSGSGSANRIDQKKTSQREEALTKFRQKRQERCFRKKVRYQSRKKLAEQRPRFRGQFVRQVSNRSTSEAEEATDS